mmetsp:Transcript_65788/g.186796  ORF Transcript_65788/g.186796 Transcript_65788/m.186796 type:complete len:116 (-) Transcript_65788:72-419(-)
MSPAKSRSLSEPDELLDSESDSELTEPDVFELLALPRAECFLERVSHELQLPKERRLVGGRGTGRCPWPCCDPSSDADSPSSDSSSSSSSSSSKGGGGGASGRGASLKEEELLVL